MEYWSTGVLGLPTPPPILPHSNSYSAGYHIAYKVVANRGVECDCGTPIYDSPLLIRTHRSRTWSSSNSRSRRLTRIRALRNDLRCNVK